MMHDITFFFFFSYPFLVPLVFSINGEEIKLLPGTWDLACTLSDYLRSSQPSFRATKVGCSEGGCGACAVVISKSNVDGHSNDEHGGETCVAINSCLRPLASLHGWNVITVEGLGNVCCSKGQ